MDLPVSFIPPSPDFTEWRVDEYGQVAVTYGCGLFPHFDPGSNRVEVWAGLPVVCMVAEDAETATLCIPGQHVYTAPATPVRSFLLFGYWKSRAGLAGHTDGTEACDR